MKGRVAGAAEGAERRHHLEGQKARRFEGRRAAGDGRGEGGAAAFMVDICGSTAALGFFRGGVLTSKLVVVSTPSIMCPSTPFDLFFPNRSTASTRPTTLPLLDSSLRRSILQPTPPASCSSSCMSSSPSSPSRKLARAPPGNTSWK
jgi:hypothetical protein